MKGEKSRHIELECSHGMSYLETIDNLGNMMFQEVNKHNHRSHHNCLRKVDVPRQKDAVVRELIKIVDMSHSTREECHRI